MPPQGDTDRPRTFACRATADPPGGNSSRQGTVGPPRDGGDGIAPERTQPSAARASASWLLAPLITSPESEPMPMKSKPRAR
jgi:hypothetical protein